jgi:hypothetical protein
LILTRRIMARLRIGGWRADKFSIRIRTSNATVVFQVQVWWRKNPDISLTTIYDQLVGLSKKALQDLPETGLDSIAIRLRESSFSHFLGSLTVEVAVTEERDEATKELQAELARLQFLRDNVFVDAALGRIWWMSQQPELVTAIGNEIFLTALQEAAVTQHSDTELSQVKMLPVLIDFVAWLGSGKDRAEFSIDVLAAVFSAMGREDLGKQLESIRATRP